MLAERTKQIKGSQTSGMRNRAKRLAEQGVAVVNFAAGELDLDTSAAIKREVHQAVDAGRNQYTDTLGIAELGPLTGDGSGMLVMAIVGGAIIPVVQGAIADRIGIHHAFILPVICYLYIVFYAFVGSKPKPVLAS